MKREGGSCFLRGMDGRWMDDIDLLKRSKLDITLRLVGLTSLPLISKPSKFFLSHSKCLHIYLRTKKSLRLIMRWWLHWTPIDRDGDSSGGEVGEVAWQNQGPLNTKVSLALRIWLCSCQWFFNLVTIFELHSLCPKMPRKSIISYSISRQSFRFRMKGNRTEMLCQFMLKGKRY